MRKDSNLMIFGAHIDWWDFVFGAGYIPTPLAPQKAAEAMEKYNSYAFPEAWAEKRARIMSKN